MYQPPVKDYEFLMRHVVDVESVLRTVTGGATTVDDVSDLLGYAASFAAEVLAPLNAVGDREGNKLQDGNVTTAPGFKEAWKTYAQNGWVGLGVPEQLGGGGMPWAVANAANEFWSGANISFSLCPGLTQAAIFCCHSVADERIKDVYMKPLVSGRWTGTMDMTEPQAGTDLAAIRTIARPQEDGTWKVKGQKIFITWGDHDMAENIIHLVLARTPDAPDGLRGLSLFLVPKLIPDEHGNCGERNAIETVSIEHKLGIHASPTCMLDYDGATGYLLGQQHGGLPIMFVMMNVARLGIAVQGLGLADRASQQAHAYALERVQGKVAARPDSTPIAEHPDVRRMLLSMRSAISAMRGLSLQVAAWIDTAMNEQDAAALALSEFFVPITKGWFTETCLQIASDVVQVHGGMGFIEETGVAQYYRDARILTIYEGTTAAHANDLVGRKVLPDEAALALDLLAQIAAIATELREEDHPVTARTADRLDAAVGAVQASTNSLLSRGEDLRSVLAVAVPYLMQWGLLAGGWMHARIIKAAVAQGDAERRLEEADFFTAHHLSQVASLTAPIEAGEIRVAELASA